MTYQILDDRWSTVQDWKGFIYTGELMKIEVGSREHTVLRVVKGKFTPSGAVRDCGDHYIKANHSSYTRIEKGTMKMTNDVEDTK